MNRCPLCRNEISTLSLTGKVIALDVGHGYSVTSLFDCGAVGNGTQEYELNVKTAYRAAELLRAMGAIVHVFNYKDSAVRLTLQAKGARAGEVKADVFVSIHHNAFNTAVQGTETLVHSAATDADEKLAKNIHASLIKYLGYEDRGIKYKQLGVLRGCPSHIAACLTEGFFMDWNVYSGRIPADVTEAYATGVALGIRDYLTTSA